MHRNAINIKISNRELLLGGGEEGVWGWYLQG